MTRTCALCAAPVDAARGFSTPGRPAGSLAPMLQHGGDLGVRTRVVARPLPTLWEVKDGPPAGAARVTTVGLCVLASSSGGNCSALIFGEGRLRRVVLVDCGLSPRKTRLMLSTLGLGLEHIDDVLLTHLDQDHFRPAWIRALPPHARFRVHERHRGRAKREGVFARRTVVFDSPFELGTGSKVTPLVLDHDSLGVAVFRIDHPGDQPGSLGFATDLGRVTPAMVNLLAGVDVLAIESNYCPDMQLASDRPEFLKRRIMDGSGHLSNEECRDAVRAILPAREVVLLHLSRQCNSPEKATSFHTNAPYRLTVARPDAPTALIHIA